LKSGLATLPLQANMTYPNLPALMRLLKGDVYRDAFLTTGTLKKRPIDIRKVLHPDQLFNGNLTKVNCLHDEKRILF